jgi:hypothetical protein
MPTHQHMKKNKDDSRIQLVDGGNNAELVRGGVRSRHRAREGKREEGETEVHKGMKGRYR